MNSTVDDWLKWLWGFLFFEHSLLTGRTLSASPRFLSEALFWCTLSSAPQHMWPAEASKGQPCCRAIKACRSLSTAAACLACPDITNVLFWDASVLRVRGVTTRWVMLTHLGWWKAGNRYYRMSETPRSAAGPCLSDTCRNQTSCDALGVFLLVFLGMHPCCLMLQCALWGSDEEGARWIFPLLVSSSSRSLITCKIPEVGGC